MSAPSPSPDSEAKRASLASWSAFLIALVVAAIAGSVACDHVPMLGRAAASEASP
jgi:hypothetical protein